MNKLYFLIFIFGIAPLAIFKELKIENKLNLGFFSVIVLTYIIAFGIRIIKDRKFLEVIDKTTGYIKENRLALKINFDDLDKFLNSQDLYLYNIWDEYKKNLIRDENGEYHQGADVGHYFNTEYLLYERLNIKLFNYIAQSFVALGIIGTFLGLAIGLGSLSDGNVFSQSEAVVSQKMNILLSGVTTSFYTSLYGLYYSLIYSIFFNIYIGNYQGKITKLKDNLKFTFAGNLMEKSIENIKYGIKNIDDKNDKLYSDISSEFQKSIEEISKINRETLEGLKNEFSEKIQDIHRLVTDSNMALSNQGEGLMRELHEKMAQMIDVSENGYKEMTLENIRNSEKIQKNIENMIKITEDKNFNILDILQNKQSEILDANKKAVEKISTSLEENSKKQVSENEKNSEIFKNGLNAMVNTIENKTVSLIENLEKKHIITINKNQEMIDKIKDFNLESTENINQKLNETLSISRGNHMKFLEEMDSLKNVFKESLSSDFSKIFQDEFLEKINHIKLELINSVVATQNILKDNMEFTENAKEKNKVTLELNEKINEKLSETFKMIYSNNYGEKISEIKDQLVEISSKNRESMNSFVEDMSKVTNEIKNNNKIYSDFNEKLKETLETITDKDFIEQLKTSKDNFVEVNKLSSDILERSFSKVDSLRETIENMDLKFEKSLSLLGDSLDIIEDKVIKLKGINVSNEETLELTQDIQKQVKKMLRKLEEEENKAI